MIGLLVIAHAPFAQALLDCAYHVYGCDPHHCDHTAAIDVEPNAEPAAVLAQARRLFESLDSGDGVLVLTDLFGATPANVATQLARGAHAEVLCGANLPMLLRALSYRSSAALPALVEKAMSGASAGVMKIASQAPQNQQLSIPDPSDATARMHHHQ
jgi:PTS system mannose-specific IIA component